MYFFEKKKKKKKLNAIATHTSKGKGKPIVWAIILFIWFFHALQLPAREHFSSLYQD